MHGIVVCVTDAMVLKSLLPNLHVRAQFFLCSIRKTALDELNSPFEARPRSNERVKMVRHDNEFVQEIGGWPIVIERVDQKFRPRLSLKERAPCPGGRA